jgi:hypothetical protein
MGNELLPDTRIAAAILVAYQFLQSHSFILVFPISPLTGIPQNINGSCTENLGHTVVKKRAVEARVLPGRVGLAVQDRVLPDEDTITSRCLTGAWENELDIVSTDVVPLLKSALQVRMKSFNALLLLCIFHQLTIHAKPFWK